MSDKKKYNMDSLIKDSMDEQLSNIPAPKLSASDAWKQMENQKKDINLFKKKRWPKKVLLAVASVLLMVLIASYPQQGAAFGRWSEMFSQVQGSVTQLFGSSDGERSRSASDGQGDDLSEFEVIETSEITTEQLTLEEAAKITNFSIVVPSAVKDFKLDQVTVMQESGQKSEEIYLNYIGGVKSFTIMEKSLVSNYAFGVTMDSDDTLVEEIKMNGYQAYLAKYKNGNVSLTWMTQANYFQIEGNLTKEEVLAIAYSM